MKHITFVSISAAAALLLSGCGSSSSSDTATGYFVDSAVVNADYDCILDNEFNKTTGPKGEFHCRNMGLVRFRIGTIELGEVRVPADGYVLPQDLVGVPRSEINHPEVIKIADFLQSIDEDGNLEDGIEVSETLKEVIQTFDISSLLDTEVDVDTLLDQLEEEVTIHHRSEEEVVAHLQETLQSIHNVTSIASPQAAGGFDINAYPETETLSSALQETIAYMGNEERLAYDVYSTLYAYHNSDPRLQSLSNVATRSEATHVGIVQSIVHRYESSGKLDTASIEGLTPVADSNISLEEMPTGQYGIEAIQTLYDTLVAKGKTSIQDALEVGCMVEVTDVNDLNNDIALAESEGAQDIVAAYEVLRAGSYNHYWAFDNALKNMGVTDGCCSLGETYCKTPEEYPQTSHGGGKGRPF